MILFPNYDVRARPLITSMEIEFYTNVRLQDSEGDWYTTTVCYPYFVENTTTIENIPNKDLMKAHREFIKMVYYAIVLMEVDKSSDAFTPHANYSEESRLLKPLRQKQ